MAENVDADLGELSAYSTSADRSADEISQLVARHLADRSIGADLLGDLGEESGWHADVESALGGLHHEASTTSSYVQSLGHAVRGAHADYVADEQLHADAFRRLERD